MGLFSRMRDGLDWRRSQGGDDERLYGAWVPDPDQDDYPYISSRRFAAGACWYIVRLPDLRLTQGAYRVTRGHRLVIRFGDGRLSSTSVRFDPDGTLVLGGIRYLSSADPDAREWPPDADLSVPIA
jgi:hypothetical protein